MKDKGLYISRMAESAKFSSKQEIIKTVVEYKRGECISVLDVGCNNGTLLDMIGEKRQGIYLHGCDSALGKIYKCNDIAFSHKGACLFDIDFESFVRSKKSLAELSEIDKYDVIILSSILHEISSYFTGPERYTDIPIYQALFLAHSILKPDGIIIIRDGLKLDNPEANKLTVTKQGFKAFKKYLRDSRCFRHSINDYDIRKNDSAYIINVAKGNPSSGKAIKEWLFTYTWGKESYKREVKEKYGILTDSEWNDLLHHAGFRVIRHDTYKEEYVQYLYKTGNFPDREELETFMDKNVGLYVITRGAKE